MTKKRSFETEEIPAGMDRRVFLRTVGGTAAVAMTTGSLAAPALLRLEGAEAETAAVGPVSPEKRRDQAYRVRVEAAKYQASLPLPAHPTNGDEERYPNKIGNFSKGLPHNSRGEVKPAAYDALVAAMASGDPRAFEKIPLGGTVKLVNPQSGLAFALEGADTHHLGIAPPPAFTSEDQAGESAETYWQALTRDVPYSRYGTEPLTRAAIQDLQLFTTYRGVDANSLFRIRIPQIPGVLAGPYVSQFLWLDVPYGPTRITQTYRTTVPGVDYLTQYQAWLDVQNGVATRLENQFEAAPRYIRNSRDLGEWVHRDFLYQAYLHAALILLSFGSEAWDERHPYAKLKTQAPRGTFGEGDILSQIGKVSNLAQRAAYYQKWSVHRRLRPEAYGARVHLRLTGAADYPVPAKLLKSAALKVVFNRFGTYLLPMAYPEGSPAHPAYPAAHATIAGACVTVLKAFFKEDFPIPKPKVATNDGRSLEDYTGGRLTVGGELNKLGMNIARGRDVAGVHWRSDGVAGLLLGEEVGIRFLHDFHGTYNEAFDGFSLRRFDGTRIIV